MTRTPWVPVHGANYIGFVSGANSICAETGVNPRDTTADTSKGRGLDVKAAGKCSGRRALHTSPGGAASV
ncbi:hypothetical protein [Desulfitobacterium hafniense]|uniref:hypothetical protein n=1 Tax=Desulfitobacterium hafniense TaxID=49338 RepID=UPI0012F72CBF|nr:hypothetical protein [Desulfitobacterium hafniense]